MKLGFIHCPAEKYTTLILLILHEFMRIIKISENFNGLNLCTMACAKIIESAISKKQIRQYGH